MVDILKQDMTNLWASSGDIVSPTATKIQEGWVVEVVPRQWWNWFENRQDTNIAYMLQKGIPEWDMVTEYLANKSYVQYFGVVYKALLTGVNKTPTTEPTYWKKAFPDSTAASEALSAVTPAADTAPYFTNGTTASTTPLTAFARTILDDVDAASVRTTISAQTLDATLTAIAGVVTSTNALIYFNGIDTATSTTLTAFGRSLIDDVDAAAGRITLELANSATIAATSANTASTIVQRDGSGNFSAGTITAALSGNASTATTLQTARTINGVSFDGSVNITVADATKLPLTGGTLTGNLTFSGARKILGTFSGGTSDTVFQSSTTNSDTRVGVIPNGTSTVGQFHAFNNSDHTNAPFVAIQANSGSGQLISGKNGTGTYLPLELHAGGASRLHIATSGDVTIGGATTITGALNARSGVLELGRIDGTAGTPFVDFHSGTTTVDYDTRIISDLPTGVVGGGRMTYTANGGHGFNGDVTLGTLISGQILATGVGNDYSTAGVQVNGNGAPNTVFPTLGFHQPSLYASSIQLRSAGVFSFYRQGGSSVADISVDKTITNGVKFPVTQLQSSDPNTLDDYEEGTFTPSITFTTPGDLSVTYNIRSGEYTKIGRDVSIILRIQTASFSHSTASGALQLTGLPFGSGSGIHTACAAGYVSGLVKSGHTQFAPLVDTFGATSMTVYASNISTGALSAVTTSDVPSGTNQDYIISATYHV